MKSSDFCEKLNLMIDNPRCELNYNLDYELLIAVMLSAQCTDKRVNIVTKQLFSKYDLRDIANLDLKTIEQMIKSLGSYTKKAFYMKEIAKSLIGNYQGKVPNNRAYLESLPGVGRKTCNVVLSELFDVPTIAVDTHVERVSKRVGIAKNNDNVAIVEKKLMNYLNKEDYNRVNHQMVLFGRYICTAKNPKCDKCLINCKHKKTKE
ncbi:MAG: endonuclease III [Firmicutes bacterium]|nr:endonuclease III [Bacillota bacterium]